MSLTKIIIPFFIVLICFKITAQTKKIEIAFLADIHFQDVYGSFNDINYKGINNPRNNKHTVLRTMQSQLNSTRIFNENYFAFKTALDDIVSRGITYVALPGDYTDDGQPIHLRGLQKILNEYKNKHGLQFFITTGNHDPAGPYKQESGKSDFLGAEGKNQPIYSKKGMYVSKKNEHPVLISNDIAKMGYTGVLNILGEYGFNAMPNYKFWTTPFATYNYNNYSFKKAQIASNLKLRTYTTIDSLQMVDTSYLVEPVDGIWLLALDGDTFLQKKDGSFSSASVGYNNTIIHKNYLIKWVKDIVTEAKKKNKTLIAFSHFPMVDFNDDATSDIKKLMGENKWQLERVPATNVAEDFANTGLKIHVAGHMHINDTGVHRSKNGNLLVNIQTPSLAAYIPGYKILKINNSNNIEVKTVTIANTENFKLLFDLYKVEYNKLKLEHNNNVWNKKILEVNTYKDFTAWHLKELIRLRFLPNDFPIDLNIFLSNVTGEELLLLATKNNELDFSKALKEIRNNTKARKNQLKIIATSLAKNNLKAKDFRKWKGLDLVFDFCRLRNADELALEDITVEKIKQYKFIYNAITSQTKYINKEDTAAKQLLLFFKIFNSFLNSEPSNHFSINLENNTITDLSKNIN